MRARTVRRLLAVLGSLALLAIAAVGTVVYLSQSSFVMERARRFGADWLTGRVAGSVEIRRVSGGGLLRGVIVHGVSIVDARGRPFLAADSIALGYDWKNLVRGRIVFDRVAVYGAVAHIERLAGDTAWNFEHVFRRRSDAAPRTRRVVALERVAIENGVVTVRLPWADEAAAGEAPDARWVIEHAPGGPVRVLRFDLASARLGHVRWESPDEPGQRIEIASLSGAAFIFRRPVQFEDVHGAVTISDSIVDIDIDSFRLPSTRGSAAGQIVLGAAGDRFDLRVTLDRFALGDLHWVDERLPETGAGRALLRVESRDGRTFILRAEGLELDAPGTRITGAFGVETGHRLAFHDVDLRASPLDLEWLSSSFRRELPAGRLTGRVQADGPLSAVRTSGDVRWVAGDGATATARWAGGIEVDGRLAARELALDVNDLDLAMVAAFAPDLALRGRLTGRVEIDGEPGSGLDVRAAIVHHSTEGDASVLDGGGRVWSSAARPAVEASFDVSPLALRALAGLSPQLGRLTGEARGRVSLAGPLDSLHITADAETSAGTVAFEATLDRRSAAPRVAAQGRVGSFAPAQIGLLRDDARLSGTFVFDLQGNSLADMRGPVRLTIDSATIREFPFERSRFAVSLADGSARVDTVFIAVPGITAAASGAIGLMSGRHGQLTVRVTGESLEPLERALFGEVLDPTNPRVRGALEAQGTLSGSIASVDFEASARLERIVYGSHGAALANARIAGVALGSDSAHLEVSAHIDSLRVRHKTADSAAVRIALAGGVTSATAEAWSDGESAVRVAASLARPDGVESRLRIDELRFRSGNRTWQLRDNATIHVASGVARVEPLTILPLSGPGVLRASGTIAWAGEAQVATRARPLDFSLELETVPFGDVIALLRPPVDAEGFVNGSVRVGGTGADPHIDAHVELRELRLERASLERVVADLSYAGQNIDARAAAFLEGRQVMVGTGRIPIDLTPGTTERRPDQPLALSVQMDSFPAAFALGPIGGFSAIDGLIHGTITTGGTTREPTLEGSLVLQRGAATWDATGVRYVQAEGTFLMVRDLVVAVNLTAGTVDPRARGSGSGRRGSARLRGNIDLRHPTDPGLDLLLEADRILAARRRDVDLTASGRVQIRGQYRTPRLSGELSIEGGALYLDEIYRQYLIVQLGSPLLFEVVDTSLVSVRRVLPPTENPFIRNLRIENARVTVGQGSWLRSREMDVEVAGGLTVTFDRVQEDLRMTGTLRAVRGTYRLEYPPFTRVFEVRGGGVTFPGTPGVDPILNITAVYTARTGGEPLDIEAVVTGTLQAPRVELRSNAEPPISQSDLASYLFFGAPTHAIHFGSAGGGTDIFGSLGRETLTATGLGYFASGLQTLAQSLGLVDYVGLTAAEAAPTAQQSGLGDVLATTRIELGRYLTPRLFVAYTQRLASPANDAGVRLEWRFHPTYTLQLFAEDRFARAPAIGLQALAARKVYGFFLFREWGY